MKEFYTIRQEYNDQGGCYSNKHFATKKLAINYLRKIAAKLYWYYKSEGIKCEYLVDSKTEISIGFFDEEEYDWSRFELGLRKSYFFESKKDFSTLPIQI